MLVSCVDRFVSICQRCLPLRLYAGQRCRPLRAQINKVTFFCLFEQSCMLTLSVSKSADAALAHSAGSQPSAWIVGGLLRAATLSTGGCPGSSSWLYTWHCSELLFYFFGDGGDASKIVFDMNMVHMKIAWICTESRTASNATSS